MESENRGNSSRRKGMPLKVKLRLGGGVPQVKVNGDGDDADDISDVRSMSSDEDSSDLLDLPEGTVVVQPEPVDEKKIRFKGPEFKSSVNSGSKKGPRGPTIVLENVFCTACGKQVNPWKPGVIKKHKELRVLICRKCHNFLGSGAIAKDKDGFDEQCRWCGEGGRLTVCDKCPRAFCKACIMRNFGRAAFTAVTESENWECYCCDPAPLDELRKQCRTVKEAVKSEGKKPSKSADSLPGKSSSSSSTRQAAPSSSSASIQSEFPDNPAALLSSLFAKVDFDEDNVVSVASNLLQATDALRHILHTIINMVGQSQDVESCHDESHTQPLFTLPPNMSLSQKRQKCAKVLGQSVHTFMGSVGKIVHTTKRAGQTSTPSKSSSKTLVKSECNGSRNPRSTSAKQGTKSTDLSSSSSSLSLTSRGSISSTTKSKESRKSRRAEAQSPAKREQELTKKDSTKKPSRLDKGKKDIGDSVEESDGKEAMEESMDFSEHGFLDDRTGQLDNDKTSDSQAFGKQGDVEGAKASTSLVQYIESNGVKQEADDYEFDKKSVSNKGTASSSTTDYLGTPSIHTAHSSQSQDDMSQQEENLFAKLELIQELAEEFCKESAKTEQGDSDSKSEIDNNESDDDLPGVWFDGAVDPVSDKSRNSFKSPIKSVRGESDKKSREKDKGSNDFSDISDSESCRGEPEGKPEPETDVKNAKYVERKVDDAGDSQNVVDSGDEHDIDCADVDSSDLILSSDDDVGQQRRRRKKKNGLSQKKKPAAVKSNSDKAEWRPGGKSKRHVKTTPKESHRRLGANHQPIDIGSDSESEDGDESESDSEVEANGKISKSKVKAAGKVSYKASEEDSDSGAGAKTKRGKSGKSDSVKDNSEGGAKKTKGRQKKDVDSSEEDGKLEKEVDNLLSGAGLRARKTNKTEDTEEEDSKPEKKSEKKKADNDKAAKGKKGGQKKTSDSSDSSDEEEDEVDEDDFEDEDDDDDLKIESTNKKLKKPLDKNNSDLENDMAKNALLDDLDEDEDDDAKDDDDSSSESDIGAVIKRKSTRQADSEDKAKKKDGLDEDDSDFEPAGARKRFRSKLLDAKVSESDSEEDIVRKKKTIGKKRKRTSDDDDSFKENDASDADSDDGSDSVVDSDEVSKGSGDVSDDSTAGKKKNGAKGKGKGKGKGKDKGKKRRRIKKMKDSSEEGQAESVSVQQADGDGDGDEPSSRKKIRKIKSDKRLRDDTKAAARAEEERRKRVTDKQKRFNGVETKEVGDGQAPITTKLVLEADEKTGEPIIQVNARLICKLKPHQVEAVQFMWECLFESLERAKKEEGSGCILAHCMGLGKTLSVVTFVHTVLTHAKKTKMKTCLVVCPLNTVLNWLNEWEIWLEEKDQLTVYEMAGIKQNWARADALEDWHNNGGIMIMGYEMLRNLSQGSRVRNKKQKAIFAKTLLDPGPDLVVCDEGHIMKNAASALSKAMMMIRTKRRVVLTGTPLQNNLIEYHCMVDFVKHNLLGTRKEFANRFVNPITNGQHSDSTQRDVRIMKARAHILHELLAGCVQRRDYSSLTKFLPPKQEYVISVRLSPMQIELYEEYLNRTGQVDGQITTRGAQLFKDYQNLMKIWTHPWVLKLAEIRDELKMKYDDEDSFIDDSDYDSEKSFGSSDSSSEESVPKMSDGEEDSAGEGTSADRRSRRLRGRNKSDDKDEIVKEWKTRSRGGEYDDLPVEDPGPQAVSNEWWAHYLKEEDQNKMELSGKLTMLFDILRMCEEIGDKVLIFSQSLLSLDIIEYFLEHVDSKFQADTEHKDDAELTEEFGKRWTKGEDYFRLDGSTSAQLRQHWAGIFNDPENHRARLFVISTRAGGLGINLVGANRVIIFDASWNPSHDVQSIFRVYRFGQFKPCYIYRFLAQGTMEEKIYDRQVTKLSLSQRVVDEHQIERHFTAADLHELYAFRPQRLTEKERPTLMLPKDVLLAEIMSGENKDWFVNTHEHDSLLENLVEQELTEEEKKAAWEDYENEKKGLRMNMPQMYGGPGFGNFLSQEYLLQTARNLREQHPDMPQEVLQAHLQRIIMIQIRQKQEEQRRLEMMQRQQEAQMAQMMQHNAMLQAQYMQSAGAMGAFPGMMPPGTRFSPSLYAHMAQPGLSAYHSAISNAVGTIPTASSASSSMASSSQMAPAKSKAQEVIDLDESN